MQNIFIHCFGNKSALGETQTKAQTTLNVLETISTAYPHSVEILKKAEPFDLQDHSLFSPLGFTKDAGK